MILMKELKEYPDGSDVLLSLLKKFPVLEEDQIEIFFTQTDKTFNRARVTKLIDSLIKLDEVKREGDYVCLPDSTEIDPNVINAFWALLHYVNKNTEFDQANFPAEIVFSDGESVHEIIVMDNDAIVKMDYLSKRKPRANKCHYDFLFASGTIDEFDDELFPDIEVTLITIEDGPKGIPKLTYHEVETL